MRRFALFVFLALVLGFAPNAVCAQSTPFPMPHWFKEVVERPQLPSQVPPAEHVQDFVVDGKIRLTLEQAIQLALANNTNVRVDELGYQISAFSVLSAHSPFDPQVQSSFIAQKSSPSAPQTQTQQLTPGALFQTTSVSYNQFFATGTNFSVGLNTDRASVIIAPPSFFSNLNFSLSQSLLRNRGLFPNRAPILIAQRNLHESRANFQAQVSQIIENVVSQYWNVVLARENLKVQQESVKEAQASYDHDKRSLELGGLGPYDIFQSESQLASRKVNAIQAEYALRQQQDSLRVIIGADLDTKLMALDMDLTEAPEPSGDLLTVDVGQVIEKAHLKRPEYDFYRDALAVDDMNIRLAHNQMQPSLNLSANYSGSTLPVLTGSVPLGPSLSQAIQLDAPSYGVNLSLNLPIRNRAAEASLGTSEVSKRRDLYNQRSNEESIQLEARNAVNQLEVAKLSVAEAKIALDLTQKNLDGEQRKYELGSVQIFELLQVQIQLTSAQQALISAEVAYQQALVAVDHATGELIEKHNVKIRDPKL
ncbi:MAG TPA: TolC family protein [Candidatus Acidoferrum sp.]|nr:TolC family protein [Candidatus Acidoferrum sp.]